VPSFSRARRDTLGHDGLNPGGRHSLGEARGRNVAISSKPAGVRAVRAADADAWARMRARLWPDADVAELAREANDFVAGGHATIVAAAFVAEDGDAIPVGFVEIAVRAFSDGCDSMPVPHVEGWYVEPSARGCGVGRRLMAAAEAWARARGFVELASDTELHNDASRHAHAACGFEEVDRLIKFRKVLR
jgi:aminoglycoside 6'-N-acetyltransferase I